VICKINKKEQELIFFLGIGFSKAGGDGVDFLVFARDLGVDI
jgi:hypothetical protein